MRKKRSTSRVWLSPAERILWDEAPPGARVALDALLELRQEPTESRWDPRQLAFRLPELLGRGVCPYDIAWLAALGLIVFREAGGNTDSGPSGWSPREEPGFPAGIEFAPTDRAVELLGDGDQDATPDRDRRAVGLVPSYQNLGRLDTFRFVPRRRQLRPRWDSETGELYLRWQLDHDRTIAEVVVKQLPRGGGTEANTDLTAAEASSPLPDLFRIGGPGTGFDPPWRKETQRTAYDQLKETVRALNSGMFHRVMRFGAERRRGKRYCTWGIRELLPLRFVLELWTVAARGA